MQMVPRMFGPVYRIVSRPELVRRQLKLLLAPGTAALVAAALPKDSAQMKPRMSWASWENLNPLSIESRDSHVRL